MVRLTKSEVEKKRTIPEGKPLFLFDDDLKGFGLRISGNTKTYIVQKYVNGKKVRVKIGHHGEFTAEQARIEAQKLLGKMASGVNPNDQKARKEVEGVTLQDLLERYITDKRLRSKTVSIYRGAVNRCCPDWLDKPITEITKDMVQERHQHLSNLQDPEHLKKLPASLRTDELLERRSKRGEGGEAQANQAMRVLRSLFTYAEIIYEDSDGRPLITENPVRRLTQARTWNRNKRRETVIKPHEIKPWFTAVFKLENTIVRDFLIVCIMTGLRREEVAQLKWSYIDLEGKTLRIPGEFTKNHKTHVMPLSDYLVALLKHREPGSLTSPYVFPGGGKSGHLCEVKRPIKQVIKESGVKFMVHDLRRTFLTIAAGIGISDYVSKTLANHTISGDVTGGYIRLDIESLREPMQKITNYIKEKAGIKSGIKLPFKKPAAKTKKSSY